jgi:hypothetical protein
LVLDVRDDLAPAAVERMRARGVMIATIDDPSERRLAADLAFHPPVPQVEAFDWTGFTGARLVGAEWMVLRRAFANAPTRAVRERQALDQRLEHSGRRAAVLDQPADMRAVMLGADLAIASFGMTAYELAATATPAIYLCLTADHAQSASLFDAHGAAITLGLHDQVEGSRLMETVTTLLGDTNRLAAMGRAGRTLVDGQGARRVADRIVALLEERYAANSPR